VGMDCVGGSGCLNAEQNMGASSLQNGKRVG